MAAVSLQRLEMSLVALLLGIVSIAKATTMADVVTEVPMTTITVPTTVDPRFVRLFHKSSTTGSITLNWTVPDPDIVESFYVESWKSDSEAKTTSPELAKNETEYTIEDLLRNTDYEMCVYANTDDAVEFSCLKAFTIPLIRWDSILALMLTILVLLTLIMLGVLCWRREKKKHKGGDDNSEDDNNMKSESSQPILLAPPEDGRPRSSIEDEDIPYITPPIDELENDERELAMKARKRSK